MSVEVDTTINLPKVPTLKSAEDIGVQKETRKRGREGEEIVAPEGKRVRTEIHIAEEERGQTVPDAWLIYCPGTDTNTHYDSVLKAVALSIINTINPPKFLEYHGPGVENDQEPDAPVSAPNTYEFLPQSLVRGLGLAFGYGIGANLREFKKELELARKNNTLPKKIALFGHSRGALAAAEKASFAAKFYPDIEIELYSLDPVVGPLDKLGTSEKDWNDKFNIPAQVKKCCVFYSTTEDRLPFAGVVTPNQFIINSHETVFVSMPVALNHAQINGIYADQDILSQNPDAYNENQRIRNAMQAVITSIMGKGLISEENKITLLQQLQNPTRTKQRSDLQLYCAVNWENLPDPGLREVFLHMHNQETLAVKSLQMLSSALLLDVRASSEQYKQKLHQNPMVKRIVAELAKDNISAYEKKINISNICEEIKTKESDTLLAQSVLQIISTPSWIPKENELMRLHQLCCENDMLFKEIQDISADTKRQKELLEDENIELTQIKKEFEENITVESVDSSRESFTRFFAVSEISAVQSTSIENKKIENKVRQQAKQQLEENKKLLPRLLACLKNIQQEINTILNKFGPNATSKPCVVKTEKPAQNIDTKSDLISGLESISQSLAPYATLGNVFSMGH